METLAEKYEDQIRGVISCFDRVIISGTLPNIRHAGAMAAYLTAVGIKLFEYTTFVNKLRNDLRENAQTIAKEAGLEIEFIRRLDDFRKEARIKEIIEERGDHPGLVHIFSAMERCTAFKPWHDKSTGRTTLIPDDGKCLHYYFYFIDEEVGLCYLRVPTWAPFRLQFYFNGHNWLARQLDDIGFAFNLVDNAFVYISDFEQAQQVADSLNIKRLHRILDRYASMCCPVVNQFRAGVEWTIMQVEYATDIVFRRREDLQRLYEPLVRAAVNAVKADDVARFLGRKQVHGNFEDELGTNFQTRIEGTRLKHHMARSSIKMYDKHGLVLRLETTSNDVNFFYHYRTVVHRGGVGSSTKVAPVLKSIYSLGVMAELLGAANRRYEAFLCALDQPNIDLRQLEKIARPVRKGGRSYRGFNLFHGIDLDLFLTLARGEYTISGFRNRDIRRQLGLRVSRVSRLLKRLRLHGLLKKVARRHKYYLTAFGRRVIACCLRMREEVVMPSLALQA